MRTAFALTALLTLGACATVHQMTADDVRATFVGMTDYGTSENGRPFVAYLSPDGTIRFQREGEDDTGRYHIEADGELCVQYQAYQQGHDICQSMWKGAGHYYSTLSDGRAGVVITAVKPGNAENL